MILGNTKERILQYLKYKGISKPRFYEDLGIKRGLLDSDKMNSTVGDTVIAKILVVYDEVDPMWLLTGEGSMLRESQTLDEKKPSAPPISPAEESLIYKMYKEKDIEVGALKEEIGALKLRIQQLESKNEESASHLLSDKVTEAFTSESLGDYGEGFSHTNQSTISKRSSAGKV